MTKKIDAVGFTLDQKQSDLVETKLKRIGYADDLIVDLIMKITTRHILLIQLLTSNGGFRLTFQVMIMILPLHLIKQWICLIIK